jgi:hypothetical protein
MGGWVDDDGQMDGWGMDGWMGGWIYLKKNKKNKSKNRLVDL